MKRRSVAQIEGSGEFKETLTVVWATGPHHVWGLAAAALGVWPIRWAGCTKWAAIQPWASEPWAGWTRSITGWRGYSDGPVLDNGLA
jgi:hypothetical protein